MPLRALGGPEGCNLGERQVFGVEWCFFYHQHLCHLSGQRHQIRPQYSSSHGDESPSTRVLRSVLTPNSASNLGSRVQCASAYARQPPKLAVKAGITQPLP